MRDPREEGAARPGNNAAAPSGQNSTLGMADKRLPELAAQATSLVTEYLTELRNFPIFPPVSAGEVASLLRSPLPTEGEPPERVIAECRAIIGNSRHNGHPRFFGYVASPAAPVGALADFIASALNQNVTSWRSAPAATEIERTVVRWLATLIGYGDNAHGLLTSGGSMANLTALFTACRTKLRASAPSRKGLWNMGAPATVYVSDQTHHSIAKAADVLGLGREQVRVVKTDEHFRMDVRNLREQIESDTENGLRPFCIVASAGTVNTGAVDPLAGVARVAREHALWFHIDGAYGAPAALDPNKRHLFSGIEAADSVSLDPHKWLYAPLGCGCLLFRDPAKVRAAWSVEEADYIRVYEETEDEAFAFWDYGTELSRPFRALKVWMILRCYGTRRLAAAISENNALAEYFAARVHQAEDFELLAPVELSICCFRYVPAEVRDALSVARDEEERASLGARLDEINMRLMHAVQRGGRAYVSNAVLRGRFALRACIVNFRTKREDIDTTLEIIREEGRAQLAEQQN